MKNQNSYDCELSDDLLFDISQTNNQSYYKKLVLLDRTQRVQDESSLESNADMTSCLFGDQSQKSVMWFLQTSES